MKIYKEDHTGIKYDYTACDCCGEDVNKQHGAFNVFNEVEISCFVGEMYYGGSDERQGWNIDCCPKCFENVLLPALNKAGFNIPKKILAVDRFRQ